MLTSVAHMTRPAGVAFLRGDSVAKSAMNRHCLPNTLNVKGRCRDEERDRGDR